MKIWVAAPGLETVYSNIDCVSGQSSVKAAEVVAGTSMRYVDEVGVWLSATIQCVNTD